MKKIKEACWFIPTITTVLSALFGYSAYSLWYVFYGTESGSDIHLYTILSGIALGWFLYLFVDSVFKKAHKAVKVVSFVFGIGLFQGLIWGFNAKLNVSGADAEDAVVAAYTVAIVLSALLLLVIFIVRAVNKRRILNGILAVFYFIASCTGFYILNKDNILEYKFTRDISFGTVSASEIVITEAEKQRCRDWYDTYILLKNDAVEVPYDFSVGGESLKENLDEWAFEVSEESEIGQVYEGGKTAYVTLTHMRSSLVATVEATIYEESATCEWTVFIENTGEENSAVISDFYSINTSLPTGKAELYYSKGSDTAAIDFSLAKKSITSLGTEFSGVEGKPTEMYLPYFNICGENHGILFSVGWSGQWKAELKKDGGNTHIVAGQESFEAYLLSGEKVRSPLVSLGFYENDNALKGFNTFRNWIINCVYPENLTDKTMTMLEVAGPMSTRTSDEIIEILDGIRPEIYENVNCFWMDAGWYNYTEGWYDGVGNWTPDASRYDNGISELSSYAEGVGCGHVLWYEPERVSYGTDFYNVGIQNEGWLIDVGSDNLMWNLANDDAWEYYATTLLASMQENGVTVYRQDFNFAPLEYWEKADAELYNGRTGICENHYITNLYKYLDYLTENIDGLIIDNCASGGKRLDLEMTKRSIPVWRSDYNCAVHNDLSEATQAHTYGLSFWLPISGTCLNVTDEYSVRSGIMPCTLIGFGGYDSPAFGFYNEQRELMLGNYYPLESGNSDTSEILAMQYSDWENLNGEAFIYKRADVDDDEYTLVLNGLMTDAQYEVYDIDAPDDIYTLSGAQLMSEGISIQLPEGEKAIIIMYSAVTE